MPLGRDKAKTLVGGAAGALLHLVLETKRKCDAGGSASAAVGPISLSARVQKNGDAALGIALSLGKGLEAEVVGWFVEHAFKPLALHRVSLDVLGNNLHPSACTRKREAMIFPRASFGG